MILYIDHAPGSNFRFGKKSNRVLKAAMARPAVPLPIQVVLALSSVVLALSSVGPEQCWP